MLPNFRRALAPALLLVALLLAPSASAVAAPSPVRIGFIGDSITGAANGAYTRQVDADLTAAGVAHTILIRGVSGAPCQDLAALFPQWLIDTQPNVVVIYCGVNDARMGLTRAQTRAALDNMANAAVNFATKPAVYFAYISYANPVAAGIGIARTDAEAEVNNAVADVTNTDYPYVTAAISLTMVPGESLFKVTDGVHLRPLGEDATGRAITNSKYFWTAVGAAGSPPPLKCGMSGHWHGNPEPAFTPCTVVAP